MLKNLLIIFTICIIWASPNLRSMTAEMLRKTAIWMEPKDTPETNPKHFKIPNPFYKEEKG